MPLSGLAGRSLYARLHLPFDFRFDLAASALQIVVSLKIHPEFRASAEIPPQPQSRVRTDTSFTFDNRVKSIARYSYREGERVYRHLQRFEKFLVQNLARVSEWNRSFASRHRPQAFYPTGSLKPQ
jgi:hypothetical protein